MESMTCNDKNIFLNPNIKEMMKKSMNQDTNKIIKKRRGYKIIKEYMIQVAITKDAPLDVWESDGIEPVGDLDENALTVNLYLSSHITSDFQNTKEHESVQIEGEEAKRIISFLEEALGY